MPGIDDVEVGDRLGEQRCTLDQADVIRYAAASGDLNPLHWDQAFAERVSPTGGVIVHGMLSLGHLARVVTAWAGAPERLLDLDARFRSPCPVGATITIGGEVVAVDREARTATLAVRVELDDGTRVIDGRRSRAVVRLD